MIASSLIDIIDHAMIQQKVPYRDPMVQIIKAIVEVRKPGPLLFSTPRIWDLDHPPISNFDHRELILHISTKRSVALLA